MSATWMRHSSRAMPRSAKPSCAPCAIPARGWRWPSGASSWSGSVICWRPRHDRRDLGLQGRELPGRGRSLLGVHAVCPGAAPAGLRRVLAGAVPPAGLGRLGPRSGAAGAFLRADEALRTRREDAPLCEGRQRFPVRGLRVARRGARTEAGRLVAELPLRHRLPPARLRPAHRAGRHRPGAAAVLDQHRSAQRAGARLLPDHRRNGGHAVGPLLRLRAAVASHPASRVSRSLALYLRSPRRGVHHRLELVDDRLAQGHGERQDRAAREHEAGRVPRVRRAAATHAPAARAGALHRRARRGGPGAAHAERLARAPLGRSGGQPRRLPLLRTALARRIQLRQGLVHAVPERLGERSDALLPGERQAGRRAAHRAERLSPERRRHVPLHLARRRRRGARRDQSRLRASLSRRPRSRRSAVRREAHSRRRAQHHAHGEGDGTVIPILALLLLQSGSVDPARAPDVPATFTATRVAPAARPVLDGRLDDPAWTRATPIEGLMQRDPQEGAAATEQVDVRILYDAEAVYIGARLFDSSPHAIIRRLGRRDATTHRDAFRVLLARYHDRRTAFEFIVHAAGVKRDVLLGDDGGYSDDSWDAVWEAATAVDSLGWTVEMRIPLSQLRFSGASLQVWGVRFERWIQRKNELDMLPLVRKTENGVASRFADLQGLENLPAPKRVEILPYVVGRGHYDTPDSPSDPFDHGSTYLGNVGGDLKYGVTSNITLDASINPDFGQVQLDPAFVNLSAFEVQLEEKRPFFVEGGNIFGFAGNGSGFAKLSDRPQFS